MRLMGILVGVALLSVSCSSNDGEVAELEARIAQLEAQITEAEVSPSSIPADTTIRVRLTGHRKGNVVTGLDCAIAGFRVTENTVARLTNEDGIQLAATVIGQPGDRCDFYFEFAEAPSGEKTYVVNVGSLQWERPGSYLKDRAWFMSLN